MNLEQFLGEVNIANKIVSNPALVKQLAIAFRHDRSLPFNTIAKLGPKPSDLEIVNTLAELIDKLLTNTNYGNLATSGKFENYLLRQYALGIADYEKISGEAIDAIGSWLGLKNRAVLEPAHQDFNKFTIDQLIRITRLPAYRQILEKIKNAARIKELKKNKNEVVLINNNRFYVVIPLNYGSCYIFNNEIGVNATFCTGSSSGEYFFNSVYAPRGPIISVLDKKNPDEVNGKWQIHAPSNQIKNATQGIDSTAKTFGELFPGLMSEIVDALRQHSTELKEKSKAITPDGYNVPEAIANLETSFPAAFTSPDNNLQLR